MLKIDSEYIDKEIYKFRENTEEYQKANTEYLEALKSQDTNTIDDAVVRMETIISNILYKKGFHDGMQFILKAMAGEEVISL